MPQLLQQLSVLSRFLIIGAFAVHLMLFLGLWIWSRRDFRAIASSLFDFTKGLRNQSLLDANAHLADQIDTFLADVNDVLDDPSRPAERRALLERMRVLDEKKQYLNSVTFETFYSVARNMIEAYPLAGVLGTILAIGAALQTDPAALQSRSMVGLILQNFGDAIWATAAGLVAAILLMFVNSWVEAPFLRLSESRRNVRETIARAKRELSLTNAAEETAV